MFLRGDGQRVRCEIYIRRLVFSFAREGSSSRALFREPCKLGSEITVCFARVKLYIYMKGKYCARAD